MPSLTQSKPPPKTQPSPPEPLGGGMRGNSGSADACRILLSCLLPAKGTGTAGYRPPPAAGAQRYPAAGRASPANGRGQGGDRGGPGGGEGKAKPGRERGPPPRGPLGPEAAAAAAAVRETGRPRPHSPCRVPPASSALIGYRRAGRAASWDNIRASHWLRRKEAPPTSVRESAKGAGGRWCYAGPSLVR